MIHTGINFATLLAELYGYHVDFLSGKMNLPDVNKKLQELIEPAILEEIQNACAIKYNIGLALFDEHNNQITGSNQNFIHNDVFDYQNQDYLDVLFHPQFKDSRLESKLANGKIVYTSFCNGELLRAVIPVHFMDHLLLKISLIQRASGVIDPKEFLDRLKQAFTGSAIPEYMFDHTLTEPDSELIFIAETLKNQLQHFLEAARERSKILQLNEELLPDLFVDDLEKEDSNLVFTTPDHVIIDATPKISGLLGFQNAFELTGLNIIENLVLLKEEQQTIRNQLQQIGKLTWYSTILKCREEKTLHAKIKIAPQTVDNFLIGYEYTILIQNSTSRVSAAAKAAIVTETVSADEPAVTNNNPPNPEIPVSVPGNPFLAPDTNIAEMFDALPNPVLVLDDKNRISVWNSMLENIFKIPARSVLGMEISELLVSDSRSQWETIRRDIKSERSGKKLMQNYSFSFLTREGDMVSANISLTSATILQKEYTTLVFREWQYQSQSSNTLQDYLHTIINSNVASLITNESGLITTINNAALAWLELTGEALLNKNIQDLFQEDTAQIINQTMQFKSSPSRQFITQLKPEIMDGKITSLKITKLDNPDHFDVFLLWELQDQKSEQNNITHKAGMNKTQKLEYLKTIFPKIARNFEKISNDLYHNTSSLLLHENMDDDLKEHIVKIKKVAQRAANLKQELQYFSRVDKPALEEINLNEKLQQWIETLRQFVPKHLSLELNLKKEAALIQANSRQIKHVLKTLIKNSVESYSTSGKIFIHTRLHRVKTDEAADLTDQKGKTFVVLEIIDSGRGIPLNVREQLFEPFVTTKAFELGRGLGLSSVYGIVKNHNGYIAVKTLEGQGTIFSLFFPLLDKTTTAETQPVKEIADVILLIDDDPGIIEVNSITLKHFGYSTLSANTAEKGIELYTKNFKDINLIILDISLPDMPGTDCAEKLLAISADTPIILSSGYHCDENYYKFMQKTGAVWLQKPYTSNKLYQIIQDLLSKKDK